MDVVDYRDMSDFAPDPDYAAFSWARDAARGRPAGARAARLPVLVRRVRRHRQRAVVHLRRGRRRVRADPLPRGGLREPLHPRRVPAQPRAVQLRGHVIERIQAHYLDAIQLIAKTFAFGAVLDGDPAAADARTSSHDGNYGPLAMGATVALDLFARILTRPEPGLLLRGRARTAWASSPRRSTSTCSLRRLGAASRTYGSTTSTSALGDGRYVHNDYDYTQGLLVGRLPDAGRRLLREDLGDVLPVRGLRLLHLELEGGLHRRALQERELRDGVPGAGAPPVREPASPATSSAYAPWVVVPPNPDGTPDGTLQYPQWHDARRASARGRSTRMLVDPELRVQRAALRHGVGRDVLPHELVAVVDQRRAHHRAGRATRCTVARRPRPTPSTIRRRA